MIYLIVDTMNDNYGMAIKDYIFLNEIAAKHYEWLEIKFVLQKIYIPIHMTTHPN